MKRALAVLMAAVLMTGCSSSPRRISKDSKRKSEVSEEKKDKDDKDDKDEKEEKDDKKNETDELVVDNVKYVGEFKDGKPEGKGELYMDDEKIGEGTVKDNIFDGKIDFTEYGEEYIFKGSFELDKFMEDRRASGIDGEGELEIVNGTDSEKDIGKFKDGVLDGEGKVLLNGILAEEGTFKNGLLDGQGKEFQAETGKLLYEGGFKNGVYDGTGNLYDENGALLGTFEFEQGQRVEESTEPDTNAQNGGTASAAVSSYVIADSSSRYLTASDISGLSKDQLRIARNEIYARHGRRFKDASLQSYFDSQPWYSGTIEPDAFDSSVLNAYEKENVKFIQSYEK